MSDINKVKQLREITGAGFKDCNLAIKESNGDLDKARNFKSKRYFQSLQENVQRCKRGSCSS